MGVERLMRVAITPVPIEFDNEPYVIIRLLDNGWDMLHLRHPDATLRDMRRIVEAVPQKYHCRLRLHGHFELINEFNIGGLHLNRRCPVVPSNYSGKISRSCHSVQEVVDSVECDYVTLSPIFDSVSKGGYRSAFTHDELMRLDGVVAPKVIALGGVTPERIKELSRYNFAGYAVLGSIPWNGTVDEVRKTIKRFEYATIHNTSVR